VSEQDKKGRLPDDDELESSGEDPTDESSEEEAEGDELDGDETSDEDDDQDELSGDAEERAEDDGAEDDGAEDDGAEDDGAEDDGVAAAASEKARAPRGSKKTRTKGLTPGERLAAAKAAKATRKAKERGRDADLVETAALKRAEEATVWVRRNRTAILGAAAALVVVVGGLVVYQMYSGQAASQGASLLWDAVETAQAQVRGADEPEGDDPPDESYSAAGERAEAAIEEYRKVIAGSEGTEAAVWASLGLGAELLRLERPEDAREAYEGALATGGSDPFVAYRALEGIAFAYESEEAWDQAESRLQELRGSNDGAFAEIADYHLARIRIVEGDTDRAKELLEQLLGRLDSDEREDAPELSFIRNQARLHLTEIDPTFAERSPGLPSGLNFGGGPGGQQQIPPELLEQLLKQQQQRPGAE
jgi:predicted negative regulator of RcsB-dependent stress response